MGEGSNQNSDYAMGGDAAELQRLTLQHQLLKQEMGDALVFAPVDFSNAGLRVFDSGCADGTWLRDLRSEISGGNLAQFVGIDIQPSFFPSDSPPWLQLHNHPMQQEFSAEWTGMFDLVHMRYGLIAAAESGPEKVIANLATLLKSGGWMQLVEADWTDTSGCGPALAEAFGLFAWTFEGMGIGADFAKKIRDWMSGSSLQNVSEKVFTVHIGTQNPTAELGLIGTDVLCRSTLSMIKFASSSAPASSSSERLSTLVSRLEEELSTQGGSFKLRAVWGQNGS
ncbi:hypothetical protein F5Y16DRAFT_50258 [Xylariaceae sp. FL0255]|nr:hypothetical protein F5Y16DRAFT_50258 [Xylariaceae sp. FL0255]